MFASLTQTTIPIVHDPPHTMTIRKLRGGELERAQAADVRNTMSGVSARRWAERVKRVMASGVSEDSAAQLALADPLNGLDRYEVIRCGLISWTYDVEGKPEAVKTARAKAIDDLDDEGAEFVATEIMRLTKPGLFLTAEEQEAAQVKDSPGSVAQ